MTPLAHDLLARIKLRGSCLPVWTKGSGKSKPHPARYPGPGSRERAKEPPAEEAGTASLWFRIPMQSENILCCFPFLDPIKIMSLLANLKKKKKKSQVPVFWATLFWDCKQVTQPSTGWVFLKGRSQRDEVHHGRGWGKDKEDSLGLLFPGGPEAVHFWVRRACPVGIFLASHWPPGSLASSAPCLLGWGVSWYEKLPGSPKVPVRGPSA